MASNGEQAANKSTFAELRRPKSTSNKESLDPVGDLAQDVGSISLTPKHEVTVLSPLAREFVPRTVAQPAAAPATMPDIIPSSAYYSNGDTHHVANGAQGWQAAADADGELESDDYFALSELKEFIDQVSSQPHLYDVYIDNLTEVLNTCIDEDEEVVLQCIVNTIVDQAIIDQNFRYSGVRLSEHLIRNLLIKTAKRSFREELLSRCQREFSRREDLAKSAYEGGKEHLRGAVLFIADLSTRLQEKQLVDYMPLFVETLLNHPSADNIKTACLVLKLCGPTLESLSQDFEKTEVKLKQLSESQPENVAALIKNVLEFKERGWQAPPLPADFVNPYADISFRPEDADLVGAVGYEETFYAGYGYPATAAGCGYPAAQYDFGECGDDENNDVVDAFEDFLRASGQTR